MIFRRGIHRTVQRSAQNFRLVFKTPPAYFFSQEKVNTSNTDSQSLVSQDGKESKEKTYVMPEIETPLEIHKPSKPVHFIEGRCLVYMNRQNLMTPFLITSHITGPMVYLYFLIKNNPFYLTFPAALPIMIFSEIGLFMKYSFHKAHYKYHVERIYLLEGGQMVEFIFSNKIRTALKDRQKGFVHILPELKMPQQNERLLPLKGLQFPTSIDSIVYPSRLRYAWTKYLQNRINYMIPGRPDYINWELMIPMMNGFTIDVSDCIQEGSLEIKCPSLQAQQQRLKTGKIEQTGRQPLADSSHNIKNREDTG